jgi:two-component system LytT family response regulator
MIRAVIVDDEPPARREMKRLLEDAGEIKVVGEAGTVDVAKGVVQRTRPDVVYLDIAMGRQSGFELLPAIDEETAVVFVTAFDQHAVRAFETGAIHYLVKPVDPVRLRTSLERVRARLSRIPDVSTTNAPSLYSAGSWIFLDTEDSPEFIQLRQITHIEADSGGSRVFTADSRSRRSFLSLAEWEERLKSPDFVRVHRSTIVNLKFVENVEPWFQYSYKLRLRGSGTEITMSRRHASRLRDLLG